MRGATTRWAGGYVRKGVYYIRRTVRGTQLELSTLCTTEAAALQQLARFEADPLGWTPAPPPPAALYLEAELVDEFLHWSRHEKGNTKAWVRKQQLALAWWGDELAGDDLRKLEVLQVKELLKGVSGWKQRAAVLKAFYGWLRQEKHLVTLAQDPVRGQLRIPAARPEQWTRSKVISREDLRAVLKRLKDPFKAAVEVLAGTGWHVSEVLRFYDAGEIERERILVCPQTKGGGQVKRIVTARTAAAARRLLAIAAAPVETFTHNTIIDALQEASAAAELANVVQPGSFRHTFATWAIEHGAVPELVSSALDHKSASTQRRFYSTLAVRPKVPSPR